LAWRREGEEGSRGGITQEEEEEEEEEKVSGAGAGTQRGL